MDTWETIREDDRYGIAAAVKTVTDVWKKTPAAAGAGMFRAISVKEQAENDKRCREVWGKLNGHLQSFPQAIQGQKMWRERAEKVLSDAMDKDVMFQLGQLPGDVRKGFLEAARTFVRHTRVFDRELVLEDLGQALRNYFVYFMLCLADGSDRWFHEAIWGYSLLYPYTDNFLDGDKTRQEKAAFNRRLEQKLNGFKTEAEDDLEQKVFHMVDSVEDIYPRKIFSGLYDFLLTIYDAQIKSMEQQGKTEKTAQELLQMSAYKGGASIYVDQCLIDGYLKEKDILFLTGFGLFLQLADDLQDVDEDAENGHQTLMTLSAGAGFLDEIVGRLLSFLKYVFENYWSGEEAYKGFVLDNSVQLVIMTVFQKKQYFSEAFKRNIEEWSVLPAGFFAWMDAENAKNRENMQHSPVNMMEILDVWCQVPSLE